MNKEEIAAREQQIIDFSELQEFIDQPFKTYSSGMKARLTFATAISVEPEVLIIDEALAVGDMLFTEKCFRRLKEIADKGTTIFFVTHALSSLYELCSLGILLDKGTIKMIDSPRKAGYAYEKLLNEARMQSLASQQLVLSNQDSSDTNFAGNRVRIEDIFVIDGSNERVTILEAGHQYTFVVRCQFIDSCEKTNISIRIQTERGIVVTGFNTMFSNDFLDGQAGEVIDVKFKWKCNLTNGNYLVGGGIAKPLKLEMPKSGHEVLHVLRDVNGFAVVNNSENLGFFSPSPEVHFEKLASSLLDKVNDD